MSDLPETKTCTKCHVNKPAAAFPYQDRAANKLMSWCKECRNTARRRTRPSRAGQPSTYKPVANPKKPGRAARVWTADDVRTCSKCGETKPINAYSIQKGSPRPDCKVCRVAYQLVREQAVNAARHAANGTRPPYRNLPPDAPKICRICQISKPQTEFYAKGYGTCKTCYQANNREKYAANPESVRQRYLRYRARPERVAELRATSRRSNQRHRIEVTIRAREWRHAHPDRAVEAARRRRARKNNAPRVEYIDKQALMERDNYTCYLWCKRKLTPREVTFDHVIPLVRGGSHTMDNLRVACLSCNSRKSSKLLSELDL